VRLLIVSRCPPWPLYLGDRLIVYHLARELTARGHTIDLIAFSNRPDDAAEQPHYRDLFRHVTLIQEPSRSAGSYALRLAGLQHFFPRSAEEAWSPEMWKAVAAQLERGGPYDVVQLFGGVQVYEFRALVEGRPNLIVPYESYTLYLSRLARQQSGRARLAALVQGQIARAYERRMFGGFGAVVVLTEADAAALQALAPTLPLAVIPNGIDLARFPPAGLTREPCTLIFTGNFEYAPNVDAARWLAREIFPLIRANRPQARLQLVGNAPPPDLLALDGGPGSAIQVTGRVPDVRPYLEGASVFVCPLRTGAGIKNKVLEAMAMGLPLVATPLSLDGIPAIAGEHALIASTVEALSAAAVHLLQDSALRGRMGSNNRRLVEAKFTWSAVAARYEALYGELV
jgi:glycosyltransferase involved in cell wall biosynthesis